LTFAFFAERLVLGLELSEALLSSLVLLFLSTLVRCSPIGGFPSFLLSCVQPCREQQRCIVRVCPPPPRARPAKTTKQAKSQSQRCEQACTPMNRRTGDRAHPHRKPTSELGRSPCKHGLGEAAAEAERPAVARERVDADGSGDDGWGRDGYGARRIGMGRIGCGVRWSLSRTAIIIVRRSGLEWAKSQRTAIVPNRPSRVQPMLGECASRTLLRTVGLAAAAAAAAVAGVAAEMRGRLVD
jgi:hypothetical protein